MLKGWFNKIFVRRGAGAPSQQVVSSRCGGVYTFRGCSDAMAVSAVYACVRMLSESVADLPMRLLKRRGEVYEPDRSGIDYLLNVEPHPGMGAYEFWRSAVRQVLLRGNAYIIPTYDPASFEISALVLCAPGTVSHDTGNDKYTVSDIVNGMFGTYDEADVIHLMGPATAYDPKTGVSVLAHARQTLDIAEASAKETLDRFVSGGNVRGIVGNGVLAKGFGEYQDEQLEAVADDIGARFASGEKIVSVPKQVDFKQLSMTSADMQFLESRKFTLREICRFFGVHPSFIFDDASNNYKSVEMANMAFLSHTLNPLLRMIECEFNRKLLTRQRASRCRFEFDRRELYACDLDARVKYQAATIAAGIRTVNDWRRAEGLPTVADGDTVLVSANLRTLAEIKTGKTNDLKDKENDQE